MNNRPVKVSIIIPVYNAENFLKDVLASATSQTLKEIEVLVVDDGSRDGSLSIARAHAKQDDRIVVLRQRNKGVSAARNAGLRSARGEYVGFIDADDSVDPRYFEALYSAAKKNLADIASAYVATENLGRQKFYNRNMKLEVARDKKTLKGVVWLNIYKRAMLEENDISFLPKLRTAEDNLFNLKAAYYANKVVAIDEDLAFYYHATREGSLMSQQHDSKSLAPLAAAVLETVRLMNALEDYDEENYLNRVFDTFGFFYARFLEHDELLVADRRRLSRMFVRIWRNLKYKDVVLELAEKKDVDVGSLVYGRVDEWLYDRYIVRREERASQKEQRRVRRTSAKMRIVKNAKRAVKAILPHGIIVLYKRRLELLSKVSAPKGDATLDDGKIAVIIPFRNVMYGDLLRASVEKAGYRAVSKPSDARYIWLHWYENGIENYADFLGKLSAIKTWKEQGRKIIVHVHNKRPHESPIPEISHALMTTLLDSADRVVMMSTETKNVLKDTWYYGDDFEKASLVPHPNYIGAYGKKLKSGAELKDDTLKILFFGLVRPYKGIEHLLEATKGLKNVEVSIFGKPKDDAYVEKVKRMCKGRTNVTFRLEHIPDEDIPGIFAAHHLVALPYSIESSLNSGAALLALSYARTIVGTNNGTLKDLEGKDLYFGYDYSDEKDHVVQLRHTLQSVQEEYDGSYNKLLEVGERAFTSVKKNNSTSAVARAIKEMVGRIG